MPFIVSPTFVFLSNGTADVTCRSAFTGVEHTLNLPITADHIARWANGAGGHIQNIMPHLTSDQREFLLTGTTPEEWNAVFPEDEDDFDPNIEDWEQEPADD